MPLLLCLSILDLHGALNRWMAMGSGNPCVGEDVLQHVLVCLCWNHVEGTSLTDMTGSNTPVRYHRQLLSCLKIGLRMLKRFTLL